MTTGRWPIVLCMADNRFLMGAHEIRMLLGGITRQRVYQITCRPDFPAPAADLSQGKVWLTADVEKWVATRRRPRQRANPPS
jgi:prophage regulatory protein